MQDLERENQQLRQRIAEQDAKILHLTKLAEGLQRQIHKTLLELAEAQAKIAELQKAKKKEKDPSSSTASAEEASASEEDAPGLSAAERARLLREERLRRRAERKGRTPKGTPRRQELPAHLERRVESVPLGECPDCHQQNWSVFPEAETSEKLDYQPAKLVVRRTERQKGRCRGCQKIFTAPLPATVVPRGQVTEGLLAHLVYSKCALHLPLARIAEDFQQQGVEMASSTLSDFMGHVADLLEPIYDTLVHRLLSKDLIQLDGTGLDVLKPGEEGKYRGQVAVYCCDDEDQITVYQFTEDKKGEHFEEFLRLKSEGRPPPYRGYIIADAGTNLDRLYHYKGVEECGCWEHAREKFVEARVSSPKEAEEGLAWINTLFEIEHQSEDAEESAPARLARRLREVPELQKGFERWRVHARRTASTGLIWAV